MARALARRYARALAEVLFEAKLDPKKVQAIKQQLAAFAALLESHAGLRNALLSPAVSQTRKVAVLDGLKKSLKWDATLRNFLAVLTEKRRLNELDNILESFDEEVYSRLGIALVEVTTAVALKADQKKRLETRLRKMTGGEVEVRYREDASLLGGAVARRGSTVYDGSLSAHLRRLESRLAQP